MQEFIVNVYVSLKGGTTIKILHYLCTQVKNSTLNS